MSEKLKVPNNITIMPIPPRSPELNPQENIWQYMRDNWLNDVIFNSYDHIVSHCCHAWRQLVKLPDTIMEIGLRGWAHAF